MEEDPRITEVEEGVGEGPGPDRQNEGEANEITTITTMEGGEIIVRKEGTMTGREEEIIVRIATIEGIEITEVIEEIAEGILSLGEDLLETMKVVGLEDAEAVTTMAVGIGGEDEEVVITGIKHFSSNS